MNTRLAILITSPIVLTIAIALLGIGINLVGRTAGSMGSSKAPTAIVVAAVLIWLLHTGYVLGSWFYLAERHLLAILLMAPIAFVGASCVAFVFARIILPNPEASGGNLLTLGLIGAIAVLLAYLAPIVVLLLARGAAC